jgi:hypothetical protein
LGLNFNHDLRVCATNLFTIFFPELMSPPDDVYPTWRTSLIHKKTLPTEVRALWFAVFILSSLWFLYWICYDVYVWDKVITQVRPLNYVGLAISVTLAIFGTQLEKISISEKINLG